MLELLVLGELPQGKEMAEPIIRAADVWKEYRTDAQSGFALRGAHLEVYPTEVVALFGKSGSGKTTLLNLLAGLDEPTRGTIELEGHDLKTLGEKGRTNLRRNRIGFVFQFFNLLPTLTVLENVFLALELTGARSNGAALEALDLVGLGGKARRYPHELSGGQRQRVGIARALAMEPSFIVCDEPVSALDVSIQGQIINLLEDLQRRLGLTYLFIAHDLAVVRYISTRVVVMYLGRIMEVADRNTLYSAPLHPYTKALLDAAPVPDPQAERARAPRMLRGEIPSPLSPPGGCVFHTRCPLASEECRRVVPEPREARPGHLVACIKA